MATRNVQGSWKAFQSNGFTVSFTIFQDGNGKLTGSAFTAGLSTQNCEGSVTVDRFVLQVPWDQTDSVGEYSGTFNLFGRLTGQSIDLTHPGNVAHWHSGDKTFPRID